MHTGSKKQREENNKNTSCQITHNRKWTRKQVGGMSVQQSNIESWHGALLSVERGLMVFDVSGL